MTDFRTRSRPSHPALRRGALPGQLLLTATLLALLVATAAAWPAKAVPGTQDRLKSDIQYLSSDKLEGRGVGTKGLNLAADYIRKQFQQAGLDVKRVDGDAFQKFTLVTDVKLAAPNSVKLVGPKGKSIDLKVGRDFEVCAFGGSGKISGELVFLGYAIDASEAHYSDIKGVDLKGKIAVIMRRTPLQSDTSGPFAAPHGGISRHAALRSKVSNAFGAGAKAILFVNDPHSNRHNAQQALARARDAVVTAAVAFNSTKPSEEKKLAESRRRLKAAVERFEGLASAGGGKVGADPDPMNARGSVFSTDGPSIARVARWDETELQGKASRE